MKCLHYSAYITQYSEAGRQTDTERESMRVSWRLAINGSKPCGCTDVKPAAVPSYFWLCISGEGCQQCCMDPRLLFFLGGGQNRIDPCLLWGGDTKDGRSKDLLSYVSSCCHDLFCEGSLSLGLLRGVLSFNNKRVYAALLLLDFATPAVFFCFE